MNKLNYCILSTLTYASSQIFDINIPFEFGSRTHRGSYVIPIELGLAGSNRTISTYAGFSNSPSYFIAHSFETDGITRADRLILGADENHQLVIPVDLDISENQQLVTIGIQPASPFLRTVGGLMVVPESSTGGQIIINPSNPCSHVLGEQMEYTRIVSSDHSWTVSAQFSVSDIVSEPANVVLIPSLETWFLPGDVFGLITAALHTRATIDSSYVVTMHNEATDINELPILYIAMRNTQGGIFTLGIPPADYLIPSGDPNHYRLIARPSLGMGNCMIGRTFLEKIAIHFDSTNRLIGFGEPRAEL